MADSITRCDWGAQGKPAPDWIGGHGPRSEPIGNEAMAKILLIEDDCETAEEITAELEQRGYETEWGASGIEGLDQARSCRPDAMIVDRMLPGMDGLTIIEALRQEQTRTPVLVLSALGSVDDRVRGLRMGGDDYLMMRRSDQLLTRAMLLEEVWNYKFVPTTNLVDVHMGRLRHKAGRTRGTANDSQCSRRRVCSS
jgi:DNA-binding response OmpR family regulator